MTAIVDQQLHHGSLHEIYVIFPRRQSNTIDCISSEEVIPRRICFHGDRSIYCHYRSSKATQACYGPLRWKGKPPRRDFRGSDVQFFGENTVDPRLQNDPLTFLTTSVMHYALGSRFAPINLSHSVAAVRNMPCSFLVISRRFPPGVSSVHNLHNCSRSAPGDCISYLMQIKIFAYFNISPAAVRLLGL